MKPGYKTTEFWLMVAFQLIGVFVYESGACDNSEGYMKTVCTMGTYILQLAALMGYTYQRMKLKIGGQS
jgi:hypothetical protein